MATRRVKLLLFANLLILITLLLIPVSKAEVPALIVFGDSSVDSGNNNVIPTVLKSNFWPYGRDFQNGRPTGRFCNGRLPPDFISEAFGLKPMIPAYLDPNYNISDFVTGVCFASAGTGYDNVTSRVLNVIPLWQELEYYKEYQTKLRSLIGKRKANKIFHEAVYLMSIGTNDFLENYYTIPVRRSQFTVKQYQDFLIGLSENFVREIYKLGARKLSLAGVPPMGCLPLERATNFMNEHECVEEYNNVGLEFNAKLENLVEKLNKELHGMKIIYTDVYGIFYDIVKKPSSYGFEVAEMACCSTGTFEMSYLCSERNPFTCSDANKFVFWDAFHPTEKTNQIISNHLIPILLSTFG